MIIEVVKTLLILFALSMATPFLIYAALSGSNSEVTNLLKSMVSKNIKDSKDDKINEKN